MKGISGKHPHPLVVAVQLIFEYTYQDECKCDGWMWHLIDTLREGQWLNKNKQWLKDYLASVLFYIPSKASACSLWKIIFLCNLDKHTTTVSVTPDWPEVWQ